MTLNSTTGASILKTLWKDDEIKTIGLKGSAFFNEVKKREDFFGDGKKVPVQIGTPTGRSAVFTQAQAAIGATNYKHFTVTRATDYVVGRISGEMMEVARNNRGAFFDSMKRELKNAKLTSIKAISQKIMRTPLGIIGTIVSGTGPLVLRKADAALLEVGMQIFAVHTDLTTVRSGYGTITAINRNASATTASVTFSGTITGLLATDSIGIAGDENASIAGWTSWVPAAAPSSTAFFGLDRTSDSRLGGLRMTGGVGQPIEEVLLDASAEGKINGANFDRAYLNPLNMNELVKSLGSSVERSNNDGTAMAGFKGVIIRTGAGEITCYSDEYVPYNSVLVSQLDTWSLESALEVPHILDYGGGDVLRVSNADSVEFRIGYRAQLICDAPGLNMNVTLS